MTRWKNKDNKNTFIKLKRIKTRIKSPAPLVLKASTNEYLKVFSLGRPEKSQDQSVGAATASIWGYMTVDMWNINIIWRQI